MAEERKLFVHAGGGKAGSSMLQNFCAANRDKLRDYGFSYRIEERIDSRYAVSSGNGLDLYRMLDYTKSGGVRKYGQEESRSVPLESFELAKIRHFLDRSFDDQANAVISSEFLGLLDRNSWRAIKTICESIGIDLTVIYIVRDALPYYFSEYDQAIKRHGEKCSIMDFIEKRYWDHFIEIKSLHGAIGKSQISLIHYNRDGLLARFVGALGIDANIDCVGDWKTVIVNRSLTMAEREVMLMLNKQGGAPYDSTMSDIFLSCNNKGKSGLCVSSDLILSVHAKHNDEANWVNSEFFSNEQIVKPVPSVELFWGDNLANVNNIREPYEIVLRMLISELADLRVKDPSEILDRLQSYLRTPTKQQMVGIPSDFDVIAYLLLNRDVLFSGVDPYVHYAEFGQLESRVYKLT